MRPARRVVAGLVAAVLAVLLTPAAPAAAHNSLGAASPAEDAHLITAPTRVTLRFLQRLNPAYTTVVLSEGGRRLPSGEPIVDGATVTLPITATLPNGTYTVAYRVASTDGHPVQGSYAFTVADPTASDAPATPATGGPAPTAASGGGRRWTPPLAVGAVLVAAVVAALVRWRRRR